MEYLYSKIKKGTEEFFCLCEDERERQLLEQKWIARRKRYCSKVYGQLVMRDQLDGDATPRFASVSSSRSHQNVFTTVSPAHPQPPVLQRTKSRKESVATMAWQGLKARIIVSISPLQNTRSHFFCNFSFIFQGGDFPAALSHGEMIGKGRSFAPATLAHLAHDEEDGVFESAVSNRICSDFSLLFYETKPVIIIFFSAKQSQVFKGYR